MNALLLFLASALIWQASPIVKAKEVEALVVAVVVTAHAADAERAVSEARRIAIEVGAGSDFVKAFGEYAAFRAGLADSYALQFKQGSRRGCLVLVREQDVHAIRTFSPKADFALLVEMLVAHERHHCSQDVYLNDFDSSDLEILRAETEADMAALGILLPPGMDAQHDAARRAWILWRNMAAFLPGSATHWTVPGLFGDELSEAGIDQAMKLRGRAARILLHKDAGEPEKAWDDLRDSSMGSFLPTWPELLTAIRHAHGDGPGAMRAALRGMILE